MLFLLEVGRWAKQGDRESNVRLPRLPSRLACLVFQQWRVFVTVQSLFVSFLPWLVLRMGEGYRSVGLLNKLFARP